MPLFGAAVVPYKGQKYDVLKSAAKEKGNLFIDTEFPPDDKSLSFTPGKLGTVVWKRPKQICENPKLFVGGASSGDVHQGRLGNCWFVAACSCLALYKEIWTRVIPDHTDQEWDEAKPDNYQGIFHFQFWRYGQWIDVVVDDFLPTVNDELIYIHSQSKNEFWSALLEKAYAKLFGCYEVLDGGDLAEALEDFTGGVAGHMDLVEMNVSTMAVERVSFWERMLKEMSRKSLMAAAIPAKSNDEMEAATASGLVMGHAYGITCVKNIHLEGSGIFSIFNQEKLPMIRLRNPWGKGEWNGAFSDGSKEWDKMSKADRETIGLAFEEDGEFWMTFDDFCQHFRTAAVCRVVNTSLFSLSKTWHEGLSHGAWKKPVLAGGCLNDKESFLRNPQYMFDVTDDEDEVLIQLLQKSTRSKGKDDNMTIGFTILKVQENRRYRIHDLKYVDIVKSTVFKNSRSILEKATLKKGRYTIIPCTFEPGVEEQFLLRLYTGDSNNFKELTLDKPPKSALCCCANEAKLVTIIKVVKAMGLERQDRTGADPYILFSCEGEKVYSPVIKDTVNPEWNCSAIFYRKNPLKSPLKFQIWNSNILRDQYMGKHVFMSTNEMDQNRQEVDLFGRRKEGAVRKPGKIFIEITSKRHLTSV